MSGTLLGYWERVRDNHMVEFIRSGSDIRGYIVDIGKILEEYHFRVGELTVIVQEGDQNTYIGKVKCRDRDGLSWWEDTTFYIDGNKATVRDDIWRQVL